MSCQKTGCTNILCDRYSYTYGYICDECFEELIKLGANVDIDDWLWTHKDAEYPSTNEARGLFEEEFPKGG